MRAYIIRRVLLIIPTLFLVTIIVFLLARFIPGSLIDLMAAQQMGTGEDVTHEEIVEQIRRDLGLDQPIYIQYLRWLGVLPQHGLAGSAEWSLGDVSVMRITSETVAVRTDLTNTGEKASDYQVHLMLDDTVVESKQLTVQANQTMLISFLASNISEGSYDVETEGFSDFSGILQGSLGKSLITHEPIMTDILSKVPISIELGLIAIITGLLIAFPVGIYSAIRQDSFGDYIARSFAIFCMAVPGFWLATMIWVFSAKYQIGGGDLWGFLSPVYIPISENFIGNIKQFIIPGILMGMVMSGINMRMTRTMMLEVLRQDYIRTAWAKGLKERVVVLRHALKNAMIPVITIIGLELPVLIGGTVIIEQIFVLPGMGRYMIEALGQRDYAVISGVNIVMASVILCCNLLVDLTYGWLDPRIRYR